MRFGRTVWQLDAPPQTRSQRKNSGARRPAGLSWPGGKNWNLGHSGVQHPPFTGPSSNGASLSLFFVLHSGRGLCSLSLFLSSFSSFSLPLLFSLFLSALLLFFSSTSPPHLLLISSSSPLHHCSSSLPILPYRCFHSPHSSPTNQVVPSS